MAAVENGEHLWRCVECGTEAASRHENAPPLGWYAYLYGSRVIEQACSRECMLVRDWAERPGYRAVHLVTQVEASATSTEVEKRPGPQPLPCPQCGGSKWAPAVLLLPHGWKIKLGCLDCGSEFAPDVETPR